MSIQLAAIEAVHTAALQGLAANFGPGGLGPFFPAKPEQWPAWIAEAQNRRDAGSAHALTVVANGEPVGAAGLFDIDAEQGTAELALWIGRPHWGQGYGEAAGRHLLRLGFGELALSAVRSHCPLTKRAAHDCLENLGFHLTGVKARPGGAPGERAAHFEQRRELWETGQGV